MRLSYLAAGLLALGQASSAPAIDSVVSDHRLIKRATLTQVQNFGTNPSNIKMWLYVPAKLQEKPPVILVLHACAWNGPNFFNSQKFGQLAETYGYVLIYGATPKDGDCWDVSSKQSLTMNGGSDSQGLSSMVKYALDKYNGDPKRVYVTGESSGAMMTQVMAAAYPNLFEAASEFSGEPAGCFSGNGVRAWNGQCAGGQIHKTPAEWAAVVKAMAPGWTGPWPRMQIYHGDADTTLNIASYNESIKEWSGVHGYSGTPVSTIQNFAPKLTKYIYGDRLQGIWGHGVGHVVFTNETEVLKWFGIAK